MLTYETNKFLSYIHSDQSVHFHQALRTEEFHIFSVNIVHTTGKKHDKNVLQLARQTLHLM